MNICLATQEYAPYPGGIASVYENFTEIFTRHEHSVLILTIDPTGTTSDDTVEQSGRLTKVTLRKSFTANYERWKRIVQKGNRNGGFWIAMGLSMRYWMLENASRYGIDVIECTDYGGLGCFLKDSRLPPVVVCGHGAITQLADYDFYEKDINFSIITWLEKMSFQLADRIIAHNKANSDYLTRLFQVPSEICTIPWQERYRNILSSAPSFDAVVIGRLQAFKGPLACAEAIEMVVKDFPHFKLLWVGNDTYTAPKGMTWSRFLKKHFSGTWNRNFIWHPGIPKQESLALVKAAGMVLVPSVWDCYSMATLEAAALGKAVIMTHQTGASHLFTDKKDSLILPSSKPEELAKAIIHLLNDRDLPHHLESNAPSAVQKLTEENFISDRLAVYGKAGKDRKNEDDLSELWQEAELHPKQVYRKICDRLS